MLPWAEAENPRPGPGRRGPGKRPLPGHLRKAAGRARAQKRGQGRRPHRSLALSRRGGLTGEARRARPGERGSPDAAGNYPGQQLHRPQTPEVPPARRQPPARRCPPYLRPRRPLPTARTAAAAHGPHRRRRQERRAPRPPAGKGCREPAPGRPAPRHAGSCGPGGAARHAGTRRRAGLRPNPVTPVNETYGPSGIAPYPARLPPARPGCTSALGVPGSHRGACRAAGALTLPRAYEYPGPRERSWREESDGAASQQPPPPTSGNDTSLTVRYIRNHCGLQQLVEKIID